jgi:hypothetical protein
MQRSRLSLEFEIKKIKVREGKAEEAKEGKI